MVVTVRDASEAYIEFYGFNEHKLSSYGYRIDTITHDLDHVIIGRLADFIADGIPLGDAIKKSHDEHLEDFVWFKSEIIVPIYDSVIFSDALATLNNIGTAVFNYREGMCELFNNIDQHKIKTPYLELKNKGLS